MTGSRAPEGPTSCRTRRSARVEPQRAPASAAAELDWVGVDWVEVEVVGTGREDGGVDAEPPVPQPTRDSSTAAAARTPGFAYVRTNIDGSVAKVRTVGYAVLGLLADRPRTGYEIAKIMKVPIGYLWSASHSRIYTELLSLHADGFVTHRVVDGPGPRDNRIYAITASGRRALSDWVDSPLAPQPAKSELMLRVRTLWTVSPERAHRFLAAVRLDCEHRLATYSDIDEQFAAEGDAHLDPATPAFWSYATLQAGISYEQHMIHWASSVLGQLSDPALLPSPSTPGSDHGV
jgi:DNA-binding PadR family transcriptional regulator